MGGSIYKNIITFLHDCNYNTITEFNYEYERIITTKDFDLKVIQNNYSGLTFLQSYFELSKTNILNIENTLEAVQKNGK